MASNYIKAYKLYLKENAIYENLKNKKYWDIDGQHKRESFELTQSKINKLIKNALREGAVFENGIISSGTDHGKSIYNNFRDLEKTYDEKIFGDFFSLFKVETYKGFFADAFLLNKYLNRVDEIGFNPFGNSKNYLFYFWNGEDIGRAVVFIEVINTKGDWGRVKIQYFEQSKVTYKWIPIPGEALTAGEENKSFTKKTGNKKHVYICDEHTTYLIIHSWDGNFNKDSFFCNYCLSYKLESYSGVGILEKTRTKDTITEINGPISPAVYNILFQRRSFLRLEELRYSPDPEDKGFSYQSEFIQHGSEYTGVYKGSYLDNDYNNEKAIRTLLLEIDISGKIRVNDGDPGGELSGFCSLAAGNQIMYITCDFKFKVGGIPRFEIIIDIPQDKDEEIELKGVYGGYSRSSKPYIGPIILKRLAGIKNLEEALAVKINQPTAFIKDVQNTEIIQQNFSEQVVRYLIEGNFYNSPDEILNKEILFKYKAAEDKQYDGPTGIYYAYSSSSRQVGIVRYPILIESNGIIKIKTADNVIETGVAIKHYLNNFLILNFYSQELLPSGRPTKGVFVFRTSHQKGIKMAPGISLRINDSEKVQAKREFLVLQNHKNDSPGKENDKTVFDSLTFEIILPSQDPDKYNDVPAELLNVLLGREYNLMVVSNDIDKREKIIQRQEFNRQYLFQALFEYQKSKNLFSENDSLVKKKITSLLKQALQHGVYSLKLFDAFITEYCSVYKLSAPEIKNDIGPIFSTLLNEYNNNHK